MKKTQTWYKDNIQFTYCKHELNISKIPVITDII